MSRPDYPYASPPRLPEGDAVDLPSWLPGDGPLELEIGPGRGGFMFERVDARRDVRLLGMEIRRKWSSLVDERLQQQLTEQEEPSGEGRRSRCVCEDARLALPRLGPDGCLDRVFIHFPDPWWKKRHTKRLVVIDPLIEELGRLLRDDGELFVQTDVFERFLEYEARLGQHPFLLPAGDEPGSARLLHNPYAGRSNRERRADQDGLPVHRLRYHRKPR